MPVISGLRPSPAVLGLIVALAGCRSEAPKAPQEAAVPASSAANAPNAPEQAPEKAAQSAADAPQTPDHTAAKGAGAAAGQAAPAPAPAARGMAGAPRPDACFDCHPDKTDGFLSTGMGRSLYPPASKPPIEDFTPAKATVKQPHSGLVYRAYVDPQGTWWQEETMPGTDYRRAVEVKWVVGSGNHTRSYLGLVEGELVQMPLTWYSRRAIWDMSPGYEVVDHFRFDRPVKPQCLFCHNDLTASRDDRLAGYEGLLIEGISCTRCHGDGTAHVAARNAGKGPPAGQPDATILNPARLDNRQQLRICQQCHLTGEARVLLDGQRWDTYDPRTPLSDHMSIYVYAEDGGADFGIASHGHRLSLSRCFTESSGTLSCTKCHDPHAKSDPRSHRAACLGCHQPTDCGPGHGSKPDAACADCHMRRGDTSDIPHVEFTDHFIRKDISDEATPPRPVTTELVDALAETRKSDEPAAARLRLGIAHAHVFRFNGKNQHAPVAARLLAQALPEQPHRVDGWEELGHVLTALGDVPAALAAFAEIEERDPDAVLYRLEQSTLYERMGDMPKAEAALRAAIAKRPDYRKAWGNLANLLQRTGRFEEAEAAYARAEALAPHAAVTAANRGHNAVSMGDLDRAGKWFAEALKRDGRDPMGPFSMATLELRRENRPAAYQWLVKAIALDPDFPMAWWIRGRMRLAEGDFAGARSDLERFTALDPKNPNAWVDLARAVQQLGDRQGALDVLLKGQAQLPGHPAIRQAMDAVSAGRPF